MSYWPRKTDKPKLLFIHIPKTAGLSIQSWMRTVYGGIRKRVHAPITHPDLLELSLESFTVIRNPYDRAFSFYTYRLRVLERKIKKFNRPENLIEIDIARQGFSQWVEKYFHEPWEADDGKVKLWNPTPVFGLVPFYPQLDWIKKDNKVSVNHILRFENLQEDFQLIKQIVDTDIDLIKKNTSQHKKSDYRDYYSTRSKKIIESFYQEDIDFFKYSF